MDFKSRTQAEHRAHAAQMLRSGGVSADYVKSEVAKGIKEHDKQLHAPGAKTHLKLATGGPARKPSTTNVIIHTGTNPAAQQMAQQQGVQQGLRAGAALGARAAAQRLGAAGGAPGGMPAGGPPPQPMGMPPGGAPMGARPPGMKRGGALSAAATTGRSMDTSTKQREGDWANTNGLFRGGKAVKRAEGGGVPAPDMAGAGSGAGRLAKAKSYGASGPVGGSPAVVGVHVPTVKVKAHTRRRGGSCE